MSKWNREDLENIWVAYDQESGEEVDRDEVLAELWKRNDQGVRYVRI